MGGSNITSIVIHGTPTTVSAWRLLLEFQKKYFKETAIRDITESKPVIPQLKHGYPLNYTAGVKELYLNLKRGRRTTSPMANSPKSNWCRTAPQPPI